MGNSTAGAEIDYLSPVDPGTDYGVNLAEIFPSPEDIDRAKYLLANVFAGDPSLRTYSFDSFKDSCAAADAVNGNAQEGCPTFMRIQQQLYSQIYNNEDKWLALLQRLPRGLVVRLDKQSFVDGRGNSPAVLDSIIAISQEHGFYRQGEDGSLEQVGTDSAREYLRQRYPVMEETTTGVIVAEAIQNEGELLIESGGVKCRAHCEDITGLMIYGISREHRDLERRSRELCHGTSLWIYQPESGSWAEAVVLPSAEDLMYGKIPVRYVEPVTIKTLFEERVTMEGVVELSVPDRVLNPQDGQEPIALTDGFEERPERYPGVSMQPTEGDPYEDVPNQFKPGALIVNRESGLIGEVVRTYPWEYVCRVQGWGHTQDLLWSALDDQSDPLYLEPLIDEDYVPGKRVLVKLPDQKNRIREYVLEQLGLFRDSSQGSEWVVLKALPVTIGERANIPQQQYYTWSREEYEKYLHNGTIRVANKALSESLDSMGALRHSATAIRDSVSSDGLIIADLYYDKDDVSFVATNAVIDLSTLPFKIYVAGPGGQLTQVRLSEIDGLENIRPLQARPVSSGKGD